MKVSITFDKNLKESNKKQWVKEIQSVVDRLNSKSDPQPSPKTTPKANRHHMEYQYQSQPQSQQPQPKQYKNQSQFQSEAQEQQEESPTRVKISKKNNNEQQDLLIRQLIKMQAVMEQRFTTIAGSINKLVDKVSQVEKRVALLEAKDQNRANADEDFDRQFAQLSLKYDKIRRQSHNSQTGSKKTMRETAASGFSSYMQYSK